MSLLLQKKALNVKWLFTFKNKDVYTIKDI